VGFDIQKNEHIFKEKSDKKKRKRILAI